MPGVAQIWLTQKELAALLMAADSSARVSRPVWAGLEPKLTEARNALGCPVPRLPYLTSRERAMALVPAVSFPHTEPASACLCQAQ